MSVLLDPFSYGYMVSAMSVAALVGGVCAFLSAYLMLKGWSLIGDALSHSVVPGVAGAYMLGMPFALGAFFSGGLAAAAMLFLSDRSGLKADVVIGLIFSGFFGLGLFMVSINPMAISVQTITMGNILAITPADTLQLLIIGFVSLAVLLAKWKDLMVVFFDESHARSVGLRPGLLKGVFFALLSACVVAAMQTVGAFLVIAMVVTPKSGSVWAHIVNLTNTSDWFRPSEFYYTAGWIVYVALILFFEVFYNNIIFNVLEISDNMKKAGSQIPGIRPGADTAEYLRKKVKHTTLLGGIGISIVATVPMVLSGVFHISNISLMGTSLVIIVGVIIENARQIDADTSAYKFEGIIR